MMEQGFHRVAFKMKLIKGFEVEYKKRHDDIWPDLQQLLNDSGIREYSIFLEEETGNLFGFLKIEQTIKLDELPSFPVMQKWWLYMSDIMETNPDNSPVSIPLKEVFYLP
jgi:L-rhamnose mutarotase